MWAASSHELRSQMAEKRNQLGSSSICFSCLPHYSETSCLPTMMDCVPLNHVTRQTFSSKWTVLP